MESLRPVEVIRIGACAQVLLGVCVCVCAHVRVCMYMCVCVCMCFVPELLLYFFWSMAR